LRTGRTANAGVEIVAQTALHHSVATGIVQSGRARTGQQVSDEVHSKPVLETVAQRTGSR
jgi:3-methyladenine DNA glycosylase/8-oxoguanine DNA glycosylase